MKIYLALFVFAAQDVFATQDQIVKQDHQHQIFKTVSDTIASKILDQDLKIPIVKTMLFNESVREYVWTSYGAPALETYNGDVSLDKHMIQKVQRWISGMEHGLTKRDSVIPFLEELKQTVIWFTYHAALALGALQLALIVFGVLKGRGFRLHLSY